MELKEARQQKMWRPQVFGVHEFLLGACFLTRPGIREKQAVAWQCWLTFGKPTRPSSNSLASHAQADSNKGDLLFRSS